MSYAQLLFQEIYNNGSDLNVTDNGIVEAIYTIISMYNTVNTFYFLSSFKVFKIFHK